jgi:hypothetical protein
LREAVAEAVKVRRKGREIIIGIITVPHLSLTITDTATRILRRSQRRSLREIRRNPKETRKSQKEETNITGVVALVALNQIDLAIKLQLRTRIYWQSKRKRTQHQPMHPQ